MDRIYAHDLHRKRVTLPVCEPRGSETIDATINYERFFKTRLRHFDKINKEWKRTGQSWYRGILYRVARDEGLGVGSGRQQSFLRSSSFIRFHSFRSLLSPPVIATKLYPFKRQRLPATQYNFRTTKSSLRIPFTGPARPTLPSPLPPFLRKYGFCYLNEAM